MSHPKVPHCQSRQRALGHGLRLSGKYGRTANAGLVQDRASMLGRLFARVESVIHSLGVSMAIRVTEIHRVLKPTGSFYSRPPSITRNSLRRSGAVVTGVIGCVANAASINSPIVQGLPAMPSAIAGVAVRRLS